MQTTQEVKCGYNAETNKHTDYAPIMGNAEPFAVADCVRGIFTGVSVHISQDLRTMYFTATAETDVRSASWLACGIMHGACCHKEFTL